MYLAKHLGIAAFLLGGLAHAEDMPSVYGHEPTISLPGLQ